jgi:hypothetical protein
MNVLTLRDAWAATPVAANHLVSVAKTLINWGIPREFSEGNPCLAIAKLASEEGGARPWPIWAYGLIEAHAREDLRRAVWLVRYTGQRQADVIRMGKQDIEDGGIKVVQQKTGKELWIPLHAELKEDMKRWEVEPLWVFVQTPNGGGYDTERFGAASTHHQTLQPLRRSASACQGGNPAARTNRSGTMIGKHRQSWKTHLFDRHREMVGDRLTVGQRTLTPPVKVRILVPQPLVYSHSLSIG